MKFQCIALALVRGIFAELYSGKGDIK